MTYAIVATRPTGRPAACRGALRLLAVVLACLGAGGAQADADDGNPAAALRAQYGAVRDRLADNPFQLPLYLESSETADSVSGSIYALVDYPFATASQALNGAARWCDILLLHLNTKYCRPAIDERGSTLRVYIGKKHDQALGDAYPVDFAYRLVAETRDYLKVTLSAARGPLATRDYRIVLEAVPQDASRTVLHLTYSYGYGLAGRLALQTYLNTIASSKSGFTVVEQPPDGVKIHVGGVRGLVERNTMRYFLAIDASLGAMSAPPSARLEKSLRDWFAAVERYPRQLHELEQNEYLDMKRNEYSRARLEARVP